MAQIQHLGDPIDGTAVFTKIQNGDGSVSLPSYSFLGDTNTGWYWIGADNPGLAAGGTKVLDATASGVTVTGTLTVTGATTLTGAVNSKLQITDTGGVYATPIVLTEAQSGRVFLVDDAAGLDFTLPALAAGQIGVNYTFLVTVTITSNNLRVTAATGDLLNGGLFVIDFDTANTGTWFAADDSDDLVFTFNGSTKGGKKGSWVQFIATTANQWHVRGQAIGDGSLATPFA